MPNTNGAFPPMSSDTKLTTTLWATLVCLGAVVAFGWTAAWTLAAREKADAVWKNTADLRIQRLEDEKCPCGTRLDQVLEALHK